ncbi:hypothetical protein HGRIS_013166 [Hohenbuehelia grisea]|uniref:Uncharacterized protein n=1 Tax=Hohenbuehelia grisea TaxID=104357 RepID=A0ABR3IUR5_9AGAR
MSSNSSSSAESWRWDIPHPVILIRFVFFALLAFLNFQVLVFAAWNISANVSSDIAAPSASIFYILSVTFLLFFILIGLVEFIHPETKTGQIKFEIGWSGAIAIFQTGITIALTVEGPTMSCQGNAPWNLCASASLLLPVAWAASLTLLTYFFALTIMSALHMQAYPNVWNCTVYTFPWFHQVGCSNKAGLKHFEEALRRPVKRSREDAWLSWNNGDLESAKNATEKFAEPPAWANNVKVRRGQDHPFGVKQDFKSASSVTSKDDDLPALPLPDLVYVPSSRYFENLADSRSASPSQRSQPVASFPPSVDNENAPIPLPRLSLWLRVNDPRDVNERTT